MSKSILSPHGRSIETPESGRVVELNLYTCCHCRFTWEAATGSLGGKLAGGFCGRCVGYVCRNPACLECVPFEQRLENLEAGRRALAPRRLLLPGVAMPGKIVDTSAVPDLYLLKGG